MLDVHRIKVGAGPVPEPDPDDGPSANRSMPNYTAEPDPNDLVYADERYAAWRMRRGGLRTRDTTDAT